MSARLKNEKQFGVSVNLSALRAVHVHLKLTGSLKSQSGVFSRLDRWHKACGRCAVVDLSERFTDSLALRREIVCCHGEKAPDGRDSPSHAPVHLNKTLSPVISLLQLGITTGLLLSHIDHRMRQKILSLCVVTLTDWFHLFICLRTHAGNINGLFGFFWHSEHWKMTFINGLKSHLIIISHYLIITRKINLIILRYSLWDIVVFWRFILIIIVSKSVRTSNVSWHKLIVRS